MPSTWKSALTLLFLVGLLGVGTMWGWQALTQPIPKSLGGTTDKTPSVCQDVVVAKGAKLRPEQVTVSVFNASSRSGLAGSTMDLLVAQGFGEGEKGNAPSGTTVKLAQVWTPDLNDPAALLVKSWLGKRAELIEGPDLGAGVTVVVGPDFEKLAAGSPSVTSTSDSTVCSPTAGS